MYNLCSTVCTVVQMKKKTERIICASDRRKRFAAFKSEENSMCKNKAASVETLGPGPQVCFQNHSRWKFSRFAHESNTHVGLLPWLPCLRETDLVRELDVLWFWHWHKFLTHQRKTGQKRRCKWFYLKFKGNFINSENKTVFWLTIDGSFVCGGGASILTGQATYQSCPVWAKQHQGNTTTRRWTQTLQITCRLWPLCRLRAAAMLLWTTRPSQVLLFHLSWTKPPDAWLVGIHPQPEEIISAPSSQSNEVLINLQ